MKRKDALSLLELGNAATREEINARAIKLFKEFHPDKHAEATGNPTLKKLLEEKFNKVREARDCLLNGDDPDDDFEDEADDDFEDEDDEDSYDDSQEDSDEEQRACESIGITFVEFAVAVRRLSGVFYRVGEVYLETPKNSAVPMPRPKEAEPAERVIEEVFPGLIKLLQRSQVVDTIILRAKMELMKVLESNPSFQDAAWQILQADEVAPALIDIPLAGIAVAYSILGNPTRALIPNHLEVLKSTWDAANGREDALGTLGEGILAAMGASLSGIVNVMQQPAETLNIVLGDEPWFSLVGAFMRRLAGLSFWTALKLLPNGSQQYGDHVSTGARANESPEPAEGGKEDKVYDELRARHLRPGATAEKSSGETWNDVFLRLAYEHAYHKNWIQASIAIEQIQGFAGPDFDQYTRLRNLIRKKYEEIEADGRMGVDDYNSGPDECAY